VELIACLPSLSSVDLKVLLSRYSTWEVPARTPRSTILSHILNTHQFLAFLYWQMFTVSMQIYNKLEGVSTALAETQLRANF